MIANILTLQQDTIPPDPDEAALRYLIENVRPGQWPKLAEALRVVKNHGGHGRIALEIKDGYVQGHIKFECSL
jgi:hypothetical protein